MRWLALVLAIALVVTAAAQSGNQGSITGTVRDPKGAVIPGVAVLARNLDTSASFSTTTDDHGLFRFVVLPVGTYDVTAEHPGFAALVQKEVALTVGAKVNLALSLAIALRAESVSVSSEAPLVETTRTSVSSTVDQRSVASLPLNGRNFLNFILLTPGVTTAGGLSGGFFSFAGQISMNSLLVDGADNNGFNASPVGTAYPNRYLFSQEAVQEFQVNTSSYSAEFGRAGTAVINVITKSGTNQFHGSAFWYYRDRGLNATGSIEKLTGQPKAPFHAHQFGAAVGGPIVKDRLFFYASYDGQRRSEQNLTLLNLPSGFALSPDPTIAGFQQLALDYLAARADPYIRTFDQNVILGKLDWHIGHAHLLSGQWNRHRLQAPNFAIVGPQQALEHTASDDQIADTLSGSLTSVLSPSKVNVVRFSYVSSHSPQVPNSNNSEAIVSEGGQQVLLVGRSPRFPVDNGVRRGEWSDTLSLSRGSHAFKLGGNVLVERGTFFSALNFFGSYRFNSLESFGRSLAGAPLPQPGERYIQAFSGEGEPPIDVHPNYVELAGFAQDAWRIRPSLTLELGLRYEVQIMTQSRVLNPAPALASAGVDTTFIPTDSNNFAPRFGFAWSPLRNQRLVVRGGYGLYFPRFLAATAARAFFQNGITVQTRTFMGASIPAYPNTVCGPPDPSGAPPSCAAPTAGADIIMAIPRNYQQAVIQQGSLGVEYELLKNLALSITYLRVKGDHLTHWQDINLPDPVATSIGIAGTNTVLTYRRYSSSRPIPGFDRILLLNANGNSSYHGLAVQVNKRFSRDFQFTASYTLSKVIDDSPTLGALNPGPGDAGMLSDSLDPRLDRGAGDYGQRHRFVLSGIWDLNYGNRLPQPAKAILAGWEVSGILTVDSGQPYSGLVNFDLNNDGNAATDRTPGLSRNSFYLPTTVSFDPRVTRQLALNERVRLQVSWDAFNVFNRANISAVRTTQFARSVSAAVCGIAGTPCLIPQHAGATAFATPTEALDPRIMQFALKLLF